MIHPSYVDLMKVVNKDVEEGETPVINSRYSIVMATAKRARQIVDGDEPLVRVSRGEKPLSTAVSELNEGEIRILAEDEPEEDFSENTLEMNPEEESETAESGDEAYADTDQSAEMITEADPEEDSAVDEDAAE